MSLKASGSVTSGSILGYLGVPYMSPPDPVPVLPLKFVTPKSPPYSNAPKPRPGIKKSSCELNGILPDGTDNGLIS